MTRTARNRIAAGLGIVAGAVILTACSEPAPNVTAQSGTDSVIVKPSTYCFDANHCKQHGVDVPTLNVRLDDKVLVDVPKKVADKGWAVQAVQADGKTVLGNSGKITDSHSYRVPTSLNEGSPFIVQVLQLDGNKSDGSMWSFVVKPNPTKS